MFVTDVMGFSSVRRAKYSVNSAKLASYREPTKLGTSCQLNTSELVELLQKSAVEHLTIFRQHEAREFGYLGRIVTTDFEAMYAYIRGEYQRCLQLSIQNVHTLVASRRSRVSRLSAQNIRTLIRDCVIPFVSTNSEFMQLMDDNIICLIGLTALVDPSCRNRNEAFNVLIRLLSLSLYLMTQCQMKLHHPVTSLALSLDYIEVARYKYKPGKLCLTLDQLLLALTEHKILRYISVGS